MDKKKKKNITSFLSSCTASLKDLISQTEKKRKAWINKTFFWVITIRIKPLSALNVKHAGIRYELPVAQYKNLTWVDPHSMYLTKEMDFLWGKKATKITWKKWKQQKSP